MSFPELDLILGVKSNDATFRGRNSGRHRFDGFIYAEECPRRKRTKKIFNNMFSVNCLFFFRVYGMEAVDSSSIGASRVCLWWWSLLRLTKLLQMVCQRDAHNAKWSHSQCFNLLRWAPIRSFEAKSMKSERQVILCGIECVFKNIWGVRM
jgi:hypothetical protein